MARAKWTTVPRDVVFQPGPDGSLHAEIPLLDGGVKQLTVVFDVTPERELRFFVRGEPGAKLTGFTGWSDL